MSDHDVLLDKQVLDHQLLDCDGRRCGNVDDLELAGAPGRGARRRRDPVGTGRVPHAACRGPRPAVRVAARAPVRRGVTRIEWSEVAGHDGAHRAAQGRAAPTGSAPATTAAGAFIAKIPGS